MAPDNIERWKASA